MVPESQMTNKVNKDSRTNLDIDFKRKNTLSQTDARGGYSLLEGIRYQPYQQGSFSFELLKFHDLSEPVMASVI